MQDQTERIMRRYNAEKDDMRKNLFLSSLQDRNETLFYSVLINNIKEMGMLLFSLVFDAHLFVRLFLCDCLFIYWLFVHLFV